jgi:predicted transcriptional regulator of viral defense system
MIKIKTISDWISSKPLRGKYTFSRDELLSAFPDIKPETVSTKLSREVRKGRIMIPVKGFYVIIPDEYMLRGFAPQPFYLDNMMNHLGRKYYVALMSAASYHGAGHQAPMTFCVMLEPPAMHDKKTDKYITQYFYRKNIPMEYVERRQTRTGYINISCPELTAIDLVAYQGRSGSVTRAATVLAELAEKTNFGRLGAEFLNVAPVACFQRLGYILDVVLDEHEAADPLYDLLKKASVRLQPAALKPGKPVEGYEMNDRWKIIVNEEIEIDEL